MTQMVVLNLLNALTFGSVLFLVAAGLSLTLGVMGIINLAHGALYMVAGYVAWSVAAQAGLNFGLAILAGALAAGLLGLLMERGFLRQLYKLANEQVLITVGFVYIFTNLSMWVWGATPKAPLIPSLLSGSFNIVDKPYPVVRIAIILIGLVSAVGLWWLQDKTRIGAMVRAGMEDKEMAMGLGINMDMVFALLFFLGALVAGFAGVIGSQLLGVNLALAWDILLYALAVVIVGGVGSVQGALLGAMIIGVVDTFVKALFPMYATYTVYIVIMLMLIAKPSGLLGRKS